MGAWTYVQPRLRASIGTLTTLRYIGRPERASPAEGYKADARRRAGAHRQGRAHVRAGIEKEGGRDALSDPPPLLPPRIVSAEASVVCSCWSLLIALAAAPRLAAQERGAAALGELVEGLGTTSRVLMIGAHPDDEDTQLIAYLAKARHIETAYLSLTRGDGGQNLIGNELGPVLGMIRTEELLAARRIDGGRQYFTRAFDFGFSKTIDETYRALAEGFDSQGRRRRSCARSGRRSSSPCGPARRPTDTGTTSSPA